MRYNWPGKGNPYLPTEIVLWWRYLGVQHCINDRNYYKPWRRIS